KVAPTEKSASKVVTVANVETNEAQAVKALPDATKSQDENKNEDNNGQDNVMPRRSRRSPRHLRVSGQRRRRYRDERTLTVSPMPLAMAVASPELASGKVFIHYPITPISDAPFIENNVENNNDVSIGNHIITHKDPQMVAITPAVSEAIVAKVEQADTTESTYTVTVSSESTTEAVAEIIAVEPQLAPAEANNIENQVEESVVNNVIDDVNTEEHVTRKENISAVLNTTEAYMHEASQQAETDAVTENVTQEVIAPVEREVTETSTSEPQVVATSVTTEETTEQHKESDVE
ncbi:ribonuclease E, partial [Proteus mirabilis]